ncbi:MAG: hypothetical protein ABI083_16180 [Lapillicoccus sp.]
MSTLPDLHSPYAVPAQAVTAFARDGHVLLRGVASSAEATAYGEVVRAAVRRLGAEDRPLAERDTYGKAFLQVMNLWRLDEGVARFVLAARRAPLPDDVDAAGRGGRRDGHPGVRQRQRRGRPAQ